MLATQTIKAQAQQKDAGKPVRLVVYKQEYKAKERKRKQVVLWAYLNIKKAAKALVASEPIESRDSKTTKFHLYSNIDNLPAIWGNLRQSAGKLPTICLCRNITPPFNKACP